jgi:hypothetical protein
MDILFYYRELVAASHLIEQQPEYSRPPAELLSFSDKRLKSADKCRAADTFS